MTDIERRQLSAGILVLMPVMAWLVVANHTDGLLPHHKIRAIYNLILATPHKPFLMAALVFGFMISILCVSFISTAGKTEFSGAYFQKFLRGTRIVSSDNLEPV
jgi:Sec-independent protein secretion pathway component TatC